MALCDFAQGSIQAVTVSRADCLPISMSCPPAPLPELRLRPPDLHSVIHPMRLTVLRESLAVRAVIFLCAASTAQLPHHRSGGIPRHVQRRAQPQPGQRIVTPSRVANRHPVASRSLFPHRCHRRKQTQSRRSSLNPFFRLRRLGELIPPKRARTSAPLRVKVRIGHVRSHILATRQERRVKPPIVHRFDQRVIADGSAPRRLAQSRDCDQPV